MREVPNSSMRFSPAELVYGRKMRGLLAVMSSLVVLGTGTGTC